MNKSSSSWESSGDWYHSLVGEGGHFYHQMILPHVIRLLNLKKGDSLLDLACGQAVLARALPAGVGYHGIDLSESLIREGKKMVRGAGIELTVGDVCQPLPLKKEARFSHAAMILAAQNMERVDLAFRQAALHLEPSACFVIVLNHPCFRIPRQSHWGVDEAKKLQYRRMDSYLSPQKIPIQTHPGKGKSSPMTISYHYPVSAYINWLVDVGFMICGMEEWSSDKQSEGRHAKREDRARREFPLFLTIVAKKMISTS